MLCLPKWNDIKFHDFQHILKKKLLARLTKMAVHSNVPLKKTGVRETKFIWVGNYIDVEAEQLRTASN